jgi:hypothetical protein
MSIMMMTFQLVSIVIARSAATKQSSGTSRPHWIASLRSQ